MAFSISPKRVLTTVAILSLALIAVPPASAAGGSPDASTNLAAEVCGFNATQGFWCRACVGEGDNRVCASHSWGVWCVGYSLNLLGFDDDGRGCV
ncbi:MAG TPA: hypothetical protein VNZ52_14100 [Candidatus Thermoplasmatota archaeon]|nr:hypothetical protein [Candidatus Thermoplasmatota archaeon]